MGQRGPIRDPNSRRGRAEILKRQKLAAAGVAPEKGGGQPPIPPVTAEGNLPTCDKCLPRRVQELYRNLVIELAAANVPIKQADSYAITMAARCLYSVEEAEKLIGDGKTPAELRISALRLVSQNGKDLQRWLELICATPGSRARIGLKPAPEKKKGPLAAILEAKLNRGS